MIVGKLNNRTFAALEIALLTLVVCLALIPKQVRAQYNWTDNIPIYNSALTVCPEIRTFKNNETFSIDVTVENIRDPSIRILKYYKLSANGTDFIIISNGKVTKSSATYYGLMPGNKLCFSAEAQPKDSAAVGETAIVNIQISYPLPTVDNPPSCKIVDPTNGQTIGGVYRVKVNATDDVQVSIVELSIDSGSWISITSNFDGTYYFYDWDTTTVPNGSHTLDARATDSASHTTYASQVTATVNNVPPGKMHVEKIDFKYTAKPAKLDIMVTIYDNAGLPVAGATVYMNIVYPGGSVKSVSAVTGTNGVATYTINRPAKGTYTVTVTNVTHGTLTYDPSANKETTDSYTVI